MPVFTIKISTKGSLISSFVFTDEVDRDAWLSEELPKIESEYGKLELLDSALPGLKIGDNCKVVGEGSEVFEIVSMKKYSDHRYGFFLSSGWWEEVAKCYEA